MPAEPRGEGSMPRGRRAQAVTRPLAERQTQGIVWPLARLSGKMRAFPSPPAPAVTPRQACLYLAQHRDLVQAEAKDHACREIDRLTLEELYDHFRGGRRQDTEF